MSKQTTGIIVGAVIVVAIAAGVIVATSGSSKPKEPATTTGSSSSSNNTNDMSSMSSDSVATTSVDIKDFMFTPMAITVKAGSTVTWTNQDSTEHSVVADTPSNDAPNGPLLAQGKSYQFTFAKAGTYKIHCGVHPNMLQTVTVTE